MKREQFQTSRVLAKEQFVCNDTWRTGLNNNDLIIGPSGAGKTRGYVSPNIRRGNESMVVTDTKGSLYHECRQRLEECGYEVLCIDFTDLSSGCGYNPLDFVRYDAQTGQYNEQDIMTIATAIVPVGKEEREPFWSIAAQGVLEALIAFVLETLPQEMHTFEYVGRLLDGLTIDSISGRNAQEVVCKKNRIRIESRMWKRFGSSHVVIYEEEPDQNGGFPAVFPLGLGDLIRELSILHPDSYAVKMYKSQILPFGSADRTFDSVRSILSTEIARLTFRSVTGLYKRQPKVDMKALGQKKTALFLTVSDTDRSQDKLVNLFYTQLFQELCRSADQDYPEHYLPMPVRIYLDDFATNTYIEDFDKIISVIRSREIYVSIILQSISQLEALYGEAKAETIINNCDHCLYLGGQDIRTTEFIGVKANKATSTILAMPLDHVYLFERGKEAMYLQKFTEEVV
ncbi:MAG: VirD4-like conjugal transfer protein, CD1115 family [Roseburia sp.]